MERQLQLFEQGMNDLALSHDYQGVRGLTYCQRFLSDSEQADVLRLVDQGVWLSDLRRRVQHYGFKYDYKARRIDVGMYVGELPGFAKALGERLIVKSLIREMPDQLIVNEYLPGQGITPHIDCEPCFKDNIVTISLGSIYEMEFANVATGEVKAFDLGTGSALVLSGEARFNWTHCIRARKTDQGRQRGRRVSLTFRNVILHESSRTAT